jgi:hypothetical protein
MANLSSEPAPEVTTIAPRTPEIGQLRTDGRSIGISIPANQGTPREVAIQSNHAAALMKADRQAR